MAVRQPFGLTSRVLRRFCAVLENEKANVSGLYERLPDGQSDPHAQEHAFISTLLGTFPLPSDRKPPRRTTIAHSAGAVVVLGRVGPVLHVPITCRRGTSQGLAGGAPSRGVGRAHDLYRQQDVRNSKLRPAMCHGY